jgi:FAD/FMN-containing dehydrogenase
MTDETAQAAAAQAEPGHAESVQAEAEQAETADEPVVAGKQSPPRVSRRQFLAYGATATGALAVGGFVGAAVQREIYDAQIPPTITPQALLDDASRLNPTAVRGVIFAGSSPTSTREVISPLLRRIADGRDPPVAVSGVRHSMGGQSLLRDGWVLDMQPLRGVELDGASRVMRVGAGATWRDVIPVLNAAGFAPTVMQSNHDFTVGGSLSVNCHGWHTNSEPIAGTVQSLRLLTADGDVVACSPQENSELFHLALGGFGMFGVILEADVAVVPNVLFRKPDFNSVPTADYARSFAQRVYEEGSPVEMAYGRLSVDPDSFLEEAIIATFTPVPDTRGHVLPLSPALSSEIARAVYRNSANSDAGKALRWFLEREAAPWLADEISRNSVLNEPAAVFANRSQDTTDILHEYFVPQARLSEFVGHAKEIIRRAEGNLLNVTVRDVRRDTQTTLAYAHGDVFGLVMSFVQERTDNGEERMRGMTRELVDASIATGGSFYLPYRLHATTDQLRRAYPAWNNAMQAKDQYDPKHVFRNGLYDAYR